jgi:predicted RNA-binding Zn ribbon-like protein
VSGSARAEPIRLAVPLGVDALLAVASSSHGPEAHFHLPKRGVGDDHHDHLRDIAAANDFLRARHEFVAPAARLTARDLAALRAIREATQALARGREDAYRRAVTRLLRASRFAIGPDGTLHAAADGWPGLAGDLLLPLVALRRSGGRLKVCANPRCLWLFFDRSRNRSRAWCDPAVCGNRVNVRRFRMRRARAR